jgi:hypothetical protein
VLDSQSQPKNINVLFLFEMCRNDVFIFWQKKKLANPKFRVIPSKIA